MRRLILIFLFLPLTLYAQKAADTLRTPASLRSDSLFLQIQIPEKDTLRTFASRLRYAACTVPNAFAFVDGKQSKVYSSGAFAGVVPIPIGKTNIRFTVRSASGDSIWKEIVVLRPESLKNSSHDTLVIEDVFMEPSQNMWLTTGDVLELRFKGSPGWEASCMIPGIDSEIKMLEQSPTEADGFAGVYTGRYVVKPGDDIRDVQVQFKLKKSFWSKEKAVSKGRITFLPEESLRVAEITGIRPYVNTGLGGDRLGGSKLGFLQPGVRVPVTGKTGSQYRIRLSGTMNAWLPQEYAKLLPIETPRPRSLAGAISVYANNSENVVTLALTEKLPYSSEQLISPNAIVVDVYGAIANTNWISQMIPARGIEHITWNQVSTDQYRMIITLQHSHWGYDIDYSGNTLRVKIRRPPVIFSRDSALSGLIIALDAGHGGEVKGAVGATGALEKDITIQIVHQIDSLVRSKGAKVILTRQAGEGPAMVNRIDQILQSGAHILVSVHCNSAGESSDPLLVRGVSTYYRSLGNKQLADILYAHMVSLGLQQFGVVGSFNFMLNSLTQLPNVLVETAFLSHPEEEIRLLDDAFRKKIAEQITAALEEYIHKYARSKD